MAEGAEQRPSLLLLPATGRAQTSRAEVKEKFTTFAKAQGFTEDTIVFLPQMGEAASLMGKRLGRIRGRPSPEGRPTCPLSSMWPLEGGSLFSPGNLDLQPMVGEVGRGICFFS